ncbi:hypothetical protein CJF42_17000 [Pseudoalteromonas sp. NBT06-2]|nr:hypothetical protein CJF42_17000 [Pseudoalteromonas sp. NBT06-2]
MSPHIPDKSYALIHTWLNIFKPKLGDILLFNHVKYGSIIKTLAHKDKQGFYWFNGENKQSVSMAEIGPISKKQIQGKVCITLSANR